MSYALSVRMQFETLRARAAGDIGAAYAVVGGPLLHPARVIIIENLTDQSVMFSFDGVHDHLALPAAGMLIMDIATNKTVSNGFFLAEGEQLYVKRIGVPVAGLVYFSVIYGLDN